MPSVQTDRYRLHYFPLDSPTPTYAVEALDPEAASAERIPLTSDDVLAVARGRLHLNGEDLGKVQDQARRRSIDSFLSVWAKGVASVTQESVVGTLRHHLQSQAASLLHRTRLRLRFVTWNLHGDPIYESSAEPFESLLMDADGPIADLICVCFQETIPLNAKNLSSSPERVSAWVERLSEYLPRDYTVLKSNRLLGLTTILFASPQIVAQAGASVRTDTIGTGLLGLWANKGAIVMNANIGADEMCAIPGLDLQVINCHLASGHGREMLEHRRKELSDIQRKFEIVGDGRLVDENWGGYDLYDELKELDIEDDDDDDDVVEPDDDDVEGGRLDDDDKPAHNGITFCCGDLNYRIFLERTHAQECIQANDLDTLRALDGLSQEREAEKIFCNFKEGELDFQPTYKYTVGTDEYDFNRIPSYCDRILYTPHGGLSQLAYGSRPELQLSDHKPVVSEFELDCDLVDHAKKAKVVSQFLKQQDKAENAARPVVEIAGQDLPTVEVHHLTRTACPEHSTLRNNGKSDLTWEILVVSNDDHQHVEIDIEPMRGTLPAGEEAQIRVSATLPIGVSKFANTSILRVHGAQDYFISYTFQVTPTTVFGRDLQDLTTTTGNGIPREIFQLVDYLSEHNYKEMFDVDTREMCDLDLQLIAMMDDRHTDVRTELLEKHLMVESIRSSAKMLVILLTNIPNGVVSSEATMHLLAHFYSKVNKSMTRRGDMNEDIVVFLLELLPSVQANCLIFLCNFFKILIKEHGFNRDKLIRRFANALFKIPAKLSRRKMMRDSNLRNLKKRRDELIGKLLID